MFRSAEPAPHVVSLELLQELRKHYQQDWYGLHGVCHWARVFENGMRLSVQDGVNQKIVQLFAVFHDSQRITEGRDQGHGERGARLAGRLRPLFDLTDGEFLLLTKACRLHTSERTHTDITLQVCFDADRLDLGRVGKVPDPYFLSTPLARQSEVIEGCYIRSLRWAKLPEQPFGLKVTRGLL